MNYSWFSTGGSRRRPATACGISVVATISSNRCFAPVQRLKPSQAQAILTIFRFLTFGYLAVFLLILAPNCLAAWPAEDYSTRIWRSDEGLPHNLVRSLAQTADGYLWIGTFAGLARFDGVHFETFDSRNTPALKNPNVSALLTDHEDTLWIGTYGNGLIRLKGGKFSHIGPEDGLVGDEIMTLLEAADGTIWIGTTAGVSHWSNGKFTNYTIKDGLTSEIVRCILQDHKGDIWIATGFGLNRIRGHIMDSFTVTNGLPHKSVRGLMEDKDGRLWIGSDVGLLCYDGKHFRLYNAADGLPDGFIQTICQDAHGTLWAGTYSGLFYFQNGKFHELTSADQEPFDLINFIFADRENTIWAGSREGLIRIIPKRFATITKRDGLSNNNVLSVEEDHSGNIWIGTWGGGLDELTGHTVKNFSQKNGFPLQLILSTCETRDGSMWVGADYDEGLARIKGHSVTHYTWKDGLFNAAVRVLREDHEGNLWIGTSAGLNRLSNGKFTSYNVTNSNLAGPIVRDLCVDHLDRLWVGTEDGLSLRQGERFTNFTTESGLSSAVVLSLCEDKNGDIWIGTSGGGLNRLHNGHFSSYGSAEGLPSDYAFEMTEDDSGNIWVSSYRGVYRARKSDFDAFDQHQISSINSAYYGRQDGLLGIVCNCTSQPSVWKCRDGRILFPTTKGFISLNSQVPLNLKPPPVRIEQLVAEGRTMDLVAPSFTNANSISLAMRDGAIEVPPGWSHLEIVYTALSLQMAEKNVFKYRLDGIDKDWIDAGQRRVAYYNNVPPGSYRFHVKACNNDGIWNETPAELAINVLPHFWNTAWFQSLVVLCLGGALALTVRYVSTRKLRRKLVTLQNLHLIEQERARIARDIHDDLGARLTQITLLSDQSQKAQQEEARASARKISAAARDLAQALDEIVWAVNPRHDTLEGLVEYLTHFADDFLEDTPVHSRIKVPDQLPSSAIPAEARHQFFLAFKEALHNAVKHGSASQIEIDLAAKNGRFEVILVDNGAGFDLANARVRGNGLGNIRQRLERIGGQFELSSHPGRGTRVTLSIRLQETASPPL